MPVCLPSSDLSHSKEHAFSFEWVGPIAHAIGPTKKYVTDKRSCTGPASSRYSLSRFDHFAVLGFEAKFRQRSFCKHPQVREVLSTKPGTVRKDHPPSWVAVLL